MAPPRSKKEEILKELLKNVSETEKPKSLEEFKRIFLTFVDNHAPDIMEQILKDKIGVEDEDSQDCHACNDPSRQAGKDTTIDVPAATKTWGYKNEIGLLVVQERHNLKMGIGKSTSSDGNTEKLGTVAQRMNTDIATESVAATPTRGSLTQQEDDSPINSNSCEKLKGKHWRSSNDNSSSESNLDTDQSTSGSQSEVSQGFPIQVVPELILRDKDAVEDEDKDVNVNVSCLSRDSGGCNDTRRQTSRENANNKHEQQTVSLSLNTSMHVPSPLDNCQKEHNNSGLKSDSHSVEQNKSDDHLNYDSSSSDYGDLDDGSASLPSESIDDNSDIEYQNKRESSGDKDPVVFKYTFSDIPDRWQKLESFAAESPHPNSDKVILAYEDVNGKYKLEYCDTFISAYERSSKLAEQDQIHKPWKTIYVDDCWEKDRPICPFSEVPDEAIMSSVAGGKTPYTCGTIIGAGGPALEKFVKLYIDTGDDGYSVPYNEVLAHFKNAVFTMGMVNGQPRQMMIAKLEIGGKEFPWHTFDVDMETCDWYAVGVPLLDEFIVTLIPGKAEAFLFAPELFEPRDRQDGGMTIQRREKPMRRESWMAGLSAFRKTPLHHLL